MPHILIFDIETCQNRPLMDLYGYKPKKEDEFPPNIFHLPCAIAVGEVDGDGILRTGGIAVSEARVLAGRSLVR